MTGPIKFKVIQCPFKVKGHQLQEKTEALVYKRQLYTLSTEPILVSNTSQKMAFIVVIHSFLPAAKRAGLWMVIHVGHVVLLDDQVADCFPGKWLWVFSRKMVVIATGPSRHFPLVDVKVCTRNLHRQHRR